MTYSLKITFDASRPNATGSLQVVGDMPALTGSEKQVEWASKIRASFAREVAAMIATQASVAVGTLLPSDADHAAKIEADIDARLSADASGAMVRKAIDAIFGRADAKYWIDEVRNASPVAVLRAAVK